MDDEQNNLSPKEIYELKKARRQEEKQKEKSKEKLKETPKKLWKYTKRVVITVAIFVLIGWLLSLIPNMPPTSAENHSEQSPAAHILTTRIPDPIQRHMLEHADGSGPSGIIIQYNCDDYECEQDLVQKLTTLVEEYPENVYLAPNNYDGKIILTKIGRRTVLDQFDEQTIRDFIE